MPTTEPEQKQSVKVFSVTHARDRNQLGEMITAWLRANPQQHIVDKVVTQSSDHEYHCITITLFTHGPMDVELNNPPSLSFENRRKA